MVSTAEWIDLTNELRRANAGRNLDCFMLQNAYAGNLWNLTGAPFQQDRSGRIVLRDTRREGSNRNKPLVVNYLKAIVDDYVALLGNVPDVKVPAPGTSVEDQTFADRIERYHYGVWHASSMQLQMKAVAWWDSVMGGTVGIVWPDFQRKHQVFRFAAPYMLYSVPDAEEPYMLAKAIMVDRQSIRSINEAYPEANLGDRGGSLNIASLGSASASSGTYGSATPPPGMVDVFKCFDKREVKTIIGGKLVRNAVHDTGICPVVHIPNLLVPGSIHRYEGDIEQAVGLAQHASFIAQAYEEYVLQDIYSNIVVEGLMEGKVPEDINPLDPNGVIPVNIGGKVYRLPAGHGSTVVGQEMSRTQGLVEYMTGVPQVRLEGSMKSSITTGRGIDRAQGPYFSRTQYRTEILAFFLEQMNAISVRMQEAIFPNATFQLFGMRGKRTDNYVLKMETKELQGYTFNKVIYSMAMGMDPMQRMVFAKQGLTGDKPLFDRRWAIEFLGITDHPDEMLKRIDQDQEIVIQQQLRLRMQASGQSPLGEQANLEGGGAGAGGTGAGGGQGAQTPSGAAASAPPAGPGAPQSLPQLEPVTTDLSSPSVTTRLSHSPGTPTMPSTSSGIRSAPIFVAPKAPPPTFNIDPQVPPSKSQGPLASGLDKPLIEQVRTIVGGLSLKGPVYAVARGDKVLVVAQKFGDAKTINNALKPIYGPRVSVRTSKVVPEGAVLITQAPVSAAGQPAGPSAPPSGGGAGASGGGPTASTPETHPNRRRRHDMAPKTSVNTRKGQPVQQTIRDTRAPKPSVGSVPDATNAPPKTTPWAR